MQEKHAGKACRKARAGKNQFGNQSRKRVINAGFSKTVFKLCD
jgi:hypothetical protein